MISVHNSIYSKNTTLRPTPLTTQSTRRSTNRRLYSPSRHPPKTRRLRHTTNHNNAKPHYRLHSIPISNSISMGNNYNQFHLFTSNRPKIINRILLCQPHGTSDRSHPYPNTMKLYRSNGPNNRTWPYILHTVLPSKLKLRTYPQSYYNSGPGPTDHPAPNSSLMTIS